jgi:hypothetical protein
VVSRDRKNRNVRVDQLPDATLQVRIGLVELVALVDDVPGKNYGVDSLVKGDLNEGVPDRCRAHGSRYHSGGKPSRFAAQMDISNAQNPKRHT